MAYTVAELEKIIQGIIDGTPKQDAHYYNATYTVQQDINRIIARSAETLKQYQSQLDEARIIEAEQLKKQAVDISPNTLNQLGENQKPVSNGLLIIAGLVVAALVLK